MTDIPEISLKLAMSLDGKIATKTGDSKWITGPLSRARVMSIRAQQDAILTGVNTVIADDPTFTVRNNEDVIDRSSNHKRIVLDTHGRSPSSARIFQDCDQNPTLIIGGPRYNDKLKNRFELMGVEFITAPLDINRIDIHFVLKLIYQTGVRKLLVESGGEVAASFLKTGFVSKVYFFYGPVILGGQDAIPAIAGDGAEGLEEIHKLLHWKIEHLGKDLLLTGSLDSQH